jgi:hypothetical protein
MDRESCRRIIIMSANTPELVECEARREIWGNISCEDI